MNENKKNLPLSIPAEYGSNFWNLKGHYFGELTLAQDAISYKGHRRTFLLKKIPIELSIDRLSIQSISFKYPRKITILHNSNRAETFLVGAGAKNEYGITRGAIPVNDHAEASVYGTNYSMHNSHSRSLVNEHLLLKSQAVLLDTYGVVVSTEISGTKESKVYDTLGVMSAVVRLIIFFIIILMLIVLMLLVIKLLG